MPYSGSGDDKTNAANALVVDVLKLNNTASPDGSVQFAQQQALQFLIENRTSDPSIPVAGQIWLRTDL